LLGNDPVTNVGYDRPMLKALLIALASLVSFDAVAWQGALRHEVVHDLLVAVSEVSALNWNWG
jgi:hypothetical protein